MDKIFVDTNIVLDLLQKRESFYKDAQQLFTLADEKQIELFVSSLTIANTHYILSKQLKMEARKILLMLKDLVTVLPLDDKIITNSLHSEIPDFEDAIQYFTVIANNMDIIITRNKKDFSGLPILLFTAKEYLNK